MTLDQTREKLKIAQYARIINYIASDIKDFEPSDTRRRLTDIADYAEQLAEDARKLAADITNESCYVRRTEEAE
jgi:hypothetical protein